jgi:hypothetical protein
VNEFRTSRHRTWLVCLLLALGMLAVYWPARHYGFVDYDDNDYVFNNPTVRAGLSWWGLAWAFVDQHASNWHPLTWLSHMLDCQLFGLNPGPAHLVNVLFHCANAVLLLFLLNSMTGAFWRSAVVVALFAWHPLRVESVAWISERKDVLSGFFFMLTLWMYALHVKREISPSPAATEEKPWAKFTSASPHLMFYKLSVGFFVLGLLSKPMLVTAPLVLLLIDFWPLNRFAAASKDTPVLKTAKKLLAEKLPFFLFSAVVGVITFFAQREGGATASGPPLGIALRMGEAVVGYLGYLKKLFWPRNLACLYLRPGHINLGGLLVAALIVGAISILAAVNLRRRPYLMMGWLWFVVMLLPVSGVVQFGLQSIADRYTYLPSIGFYVVCVWAVAELAEHFQKRSGFDEHLDLPLTRPSDTLSPALSGGEGRGEGAPRVYRETLAPPMVPRLLCGAATAAILAACALWSRHQLGYWQNTQTLMEHALKIDPNNYVAHDDLGVYFSRIGRTQDALLQFQLERELKPDLARPSENSSRSSPAPTGSK